MNNCTEEIETNILSTSRKGKINTAQVRESFMQEALYITMPMIYGLTVSYRWGN